MSTKQEELELATQQPVVTEVDNYEFEPIQGYPMLNWRGKRPFRSTQYYPAQLKEKHGEEVDDWRNKIYWGDNLQVMSHLLKSFRGKINLIYIDPPFDSNADYKKQITLNGKSITNDKTSFEEKQYSDIWNNDEYLQFMYERLILLRELLADDGVIYLHCDYRKSAHLRLIMDEVFGSDHLINEIIWKRRSGILAQTIKYGSVTDSILLYSKTDNYTFNPQYTKENTEEYIEQRFRYSDDSGEKYRLSPLLSPSYSPTLIYDYKGYKSPKKGWSVSEKTMERLDQEAKLVFPADKNKRIQRKQYLSDWEGRPIQNLWDDIPPVNPQAKERLEYPTQKPEKLMERIIRASSKQGDLVLDTFCGCGTLPAAAAKLGRRYIGADINLGAIQLTTKRLVDLTSKQSKLDNHNYNLGFEIYNVNHYDVFRNPLEAKDLLIEAFEIQKLESNNLYDGEKDGRMVKIMPVNRITTKADLNELISGFDYKLFEKRQTEKPNQPVDKLMLVCMGHEADLAATLQNEVNFKLDVEVVDILRDKSELEFKRDAEAMILIKNKKLVIKQFYPMNLLQKLSLIKENVEDWRELVESVMVDWNYDGAVLEPAVVDLPGKEELVEGEYDIPEDAGTIRVKITDLLSESLEESVNYG